jgi:hypothetical protein
MLFFRVVKSKNAAAQIKLVFVFGYAALEVWHNPAMHVFSALDGLHDARFAQNAKMFGDIVLGNLQPSGPASNSCTIRHRVLSPNALRNGVQHSESGVFMQEKLTIFQAN